MSRIIIIDDEPMICELVQMFLEEQFPETVFSSFGRVEDAFETARTEGVNLIICDQTTPGRFRGTDLLHSLRTDEGCQTPFILFTGTEFRDIQDLIPPECLTRFSILNKPFILDDLLQAIKKVNASVT